MIAFWSTVTRSHRIKNFKEFFNFTHTWLPSGQQSLVFTDLRIWKNFLTSPILDYNSQNDFHSHSFSQETSKKTDSKKQSTKESVTQVIPDLDEEVLCTDCAMIGVSMASAITGAKIKGAPLYEHLAFLSGKKVVFCLQYLSFFVISYTKKINNFAFLNTPLTCEGRLISGKSSCLPRRSSSWKYICIRKLA